MVDDSASDAEMQLGADAESHLSQRRTSQGGTLYTSPTSRTRKRGLMSRSQPRPIHTPTSPMSSTIPHNLLPSAPASPPTPAPSPTPHQRAPDWSTAAEHEDTQVRDIRALFSEMNDAEKQRLLGELLNMCNSHQLSFVHDFVSPRLKKDPFQVLPNELCLRVGLILRQARHGGCLMLTPPPYTGPHLRRRPHNPCALVAGIETMVRTCQ